MGDKMYWIWIMIFLCICTFTDIKKRNVCGWLCILNILAAIMLHTIFRDISGKSLIEGAIIGGIFLIISVVTREKIGYGDSLVFSCNRFEYGRRKMLCYNSLEFSAM